MKKYYQLAVAGRSADVTIYGDITSWEWSESDVSSYTLSHEIEGLDVDNINIYINSYGGEVAEGLAIYNALRRHKAKIRTVCDGFACSAASVVFMAGDERVMNASSLLLIHNAWAYASGDAKDLRKEANDLETITSASVAAYMKHVNITEEALKKMLDDETWIKPADALEMGFATSILADAAKGVNQSARKIVFSALTKVSAEPPKEPEPPKLNHLEKFLKGINPKGA